MRVVHPQSRDDVDGNCPDAVTLGGESYDCGGGEAFDAPRPAVRELAELYGVDAETITVSEETASDPPDGDDAVCEQCGQSHEDGACWDLIEAGECPWCDDYEGDHVGQHASSAHPDAWEDYKA